MLSGSQQSAWNPNEWKVKKELTSSDFRENRRTTSLEKKLVEENVFKHWNRNIRVRVASDSVRISMEDKDNKSEYDVHFRYYICVTDKDIHGHATMSFCQTLELPNSRLLNYFHGYHI